MAIEITVPSPGESITQVQLAKWLVADGDAVEKDQEIVEIDSDKASFPIAAPEDGVVKILSSEGETVDVGAVIATLGVLPEGISAKKITGDVKATAPKPTAVSQTVAKEATPEKANPETTANLVHTSPLARNIMAVEKVNPADVSLAFPGRKITRKEIEAVINRKKQGDQHMPQPGSREIARKKMTQLRLKLAERLVSVKNETAMLTTFNEINMQAALKIKEKYQDAFRERHGVGFGLMSIFTRAAVIALEEFPQVNSLIDGDELLTPSYIDIGIAVSAPKGLVVPVLRNAETMSMADIELKIKELAAKARENKISIDDMKGGTFTITNGGVFGSLMSTPILNPPQSAILGMHKIQERPIAVNGQVEIAPMMYVALSYDHRVIDGRESVGFLVRIKELVEDPTRMLTKGTDPVKLLLDL